MFFLSIAKGLGIKGQDGEVTFRGTLLSTGTYDYLAFLSPKTCRQKPLFLIPPYSSVGVKSMMVVFSSLRCPGDEVTKTWGHGGVAACRQGQLQLCDCRHPSFSNVHPARWLGGSVVKRWTHQHHVDERWTWRACHAGCSVIANGVELLEQLFVVRPRLLRGRVPSCDTSGPFDSGGCVGTLPRLGPDCLPVDAIAFGDLGDGCGCNAQAHARPPGATL